MSMYVSAALGLGGCHGDYVYSSGMVPQLRYSAALADAELWNTIVLECVIAENGMPDFGP